VRAEREKSIAHEIKLARDVAIQVLPEPLGHDAERMARFQREAEVLASLNPPNIASLYTKSEGMHFLFGMAAQPRRVKE
jgi:serine/threonine-protein kinase